MSLRPTSRWTVFAVITAVIAAVAGIFLLRRRSATRSAPALTWSPPPAPPAPVTAAPAPTSSVEEAPASPPLAAPSPPEPAVVQVTTWGPPEKKRTRPVGMGDVILGFVYSQLFAAIPLIGLIVFVGSRLSPDATYEESSNALTSITTAGPVIVLTMLLSWAGWMTAVWWAATHKGDRDWRTLLKWRFVPKRDIPIGIGVALAFRLYELGVAQVLRLFGVDTESLSNTATITSQTGVWLVLLALGAAIGAPVVEEIFFRGLFLSVAVRNYGKWAGVIITSVAFGLMHFQPTVAGTVLVVTQTTLIGVVLALLVLKTQRLWTAICAHLAINISGVVLALAFLGAS